MLGLLVERVIFYLLNRKTKDREIKLNRVRCVFKKSSRKAGTF